MKQAEINIGEANIEVEIANNFLRRARGLSFRKKGKMLFIFPKKTQAKIDMAFLSKKLFLYFIDENKKIISVQEASPWSWNPKTWKLYSPSQEYKFLLESFEELSLEPGDKLSFNEDLKIN